MVFSHSLCGFNGLLYSVRRSLLLCSLNIISSFRPFTSNTSITITLRSLLLTIVSIDCTIGRGRRLIRKYVNNRTYRRDRLYGVTL